MLHSYIQGCRKTWQIISGNNIIRNIQLQSPIVNFIESEAHKKKPVPMRISALELNLYVLHLVCGSHNIEPGTVSACTTIGVGKTGGGIVNRHRIEISF